MKHLSSYKCDRTDDDWDAKDPLTFTNTEARFHLSLESMLCGTLKHRTDCICQELKSIYGSSIFKCGRPGCPSYRIGFDTKPMRDEHTQRHNRPFKCRHSECPFATLGFAKETGLESHLAQTHGQFLHVEFEVTPTQTNALSEKELKAILIDAVQENDLPTIRSEADAVRKFILVLLLRAYQGRSSNSMIKHLLGEITPNFFQEPGEDRSQEMYANILRASTEHGNYDVFKMPYNLFKVFIRASDWNTVVYSTLVFLGRTRCADVLEIVASTLHETGGGFLHFQIKALLERFIPENPDTAAEILAMECFERIKPYLLMRHINPLILKVAGGCCSIAIAKLLLAEGASVNISIGGHRPLLSAAKQTSMEAAKFMEFLVRKGANSEDYVHRFKGKTLSELPGPRNIHKWIGITWEELIKQNTLSMKVSPGYKANVT